VSDGWSDERLAAGRRAWRLTLVGTFVSTLGTGLTLPFLFVYLHGVRGLPLPLAGAASAVGAVLAFAAAPVAGALGDRVGLGRLAVGGMVVQAAGAALLAPQAGTAEAFLAVALSAVGNTVVFPALNGMVAAQLPAEQRPRAYALRFGILNAGIGIGGLVSGAVVSVDRPVTFQVIYLVNAATTAAYAAIVLLGLRRSPGFAPVPKEDGAERSGPGGYRAVLTNRPFVGFLACAFLFSLFGYAQLDGPWAAFATLVVGVDPGVVGVGFAVNTAVIVVSQLLVVRLTAGWRRSRLLLVAGALWSVAWAVSAAAALPALHGAAAAAGLVVSLGVFGLGETLFSPVAGGLPNELATDALRARYNALGSTVVSVAGFIGPPVAGILLGSGAPWAWAPVVAVGMVLALGGAAMLGRVLPAGVDRPAPVGAAR
jgi:MFS family permease